MSDKLNGWLFRFVFICVFALHSVLINAQAVQPTLKLALFDVDATPPVGTQLTYDPMVNDWDLGLRAKGVVILGAGLPIVMCSVDWIGISNDSQDEFKRVMAEAAATIPSRVVVHAIHQHDAPSSDLGA